MAKKGSSTSDSPTHSNAITKTSSNQFSQPPPSSTHPTTAKESIAARRPKRRTAASEATNMKSTLVHLEDTQPASTNGNTKKLKTKPSRKSEISTSPMLAIFGNLLPGQEGIYVESRRITPSKITDSMLGKDAKILEEYVPKE